MRVFVWMGVSVEKTQSYQVSLVIFSFSYVENRGEDSEQTVKMHRVIRPLCLTSSVVGINENSKSFIRNSHVILTIY